MKSDRKRYLKSTECAYCESPYIDDKFLLYVISLK